MLQQTYCLFFHFVLGLQNQIASCYGIGGGSGGGGGGDGGCANVPRSRESIVAVDISFLVSSSTGWLSANVICSGVASMRSSTYKAGKNPTLPAAFFPVTHSSSIFLLLTTVITSPTFNLRQWSLGVVCTRAVL
jgi:hypothetical protein